MQDSATTGLRPEGERPGMEPGSQHTCDVKDDG